MKKRILAIVSAAVLALGCFASANAATYSAALNGTAGNAAEKKAAKLVADGAVFSTTGFKFTVADYLGQDGADAEEWSIDQFALNLGGATVDENRFIALAHLIAQYPTNKYKVLRVVTLSGDDIDTDYPVNVTVADTDIKANKKYAIIRMNRWTGEWNDGVNTVTSSKAGLLKFKATKTGPIAIVEIKGASAAATETAAAAKTAAATTGKTAAKTGEV